MTKKHDKHMWAGNRIIQYSATTLFISCWIEFRGSSAKKKKEKKYPHILPDILVTN